MEISNEDYHQAMIDIRNAELDKCGGCIYYDPNGTAEGVGYCGYSSEGHCQYTPSDTAPCPRCGTTMTRPNGEYYVCGSCGKRYPGI